MTPRASVLRTGRLLAYLRDLDAARTVLWCYLLWYLVVAIRYFDPDPHIWLGSLGISAIIGLALLLNAGWRPFHPSALGRWQALRFFAMPFCVSSFASLVKGHAFVLVFSLGSRTRCSASPLAEGSSWSG